MGELACPQCGNPNLDVDEQNSVVYCKKCGFAVQVDPKTGEAVPISQGGAPGGAMPGAPMAGAPAAYNDHSIFGMDPLTFWMGGFAIILLLFFLRVVSDLMIIAALVVILTIIWWMKR